MQTLNFCILQGHLLLQLGYLSLEEKKASDALSLEELEKDHGRVRAAGAQLG